jgi:hypothetical protein
MGGTAARQLCTIFQNEDYVALATHNTYRTYCNGLRLDCQPWRRCLVADWWGALTLMLAA